MTFISHRPGFSNFPPLLPDFPDLYFVRYRTQPFPHKKNTFSYSFHTFAHIRQQYFSKYWGTNAWAVPPPQTLGGPSPQSPRFPPLQAECSNKLVTVSHYETINGRCLIYIKVYRLIVG